jgi:hypothetical protein
MLDQLRNLLAERDEQKEAESAFKAQCHEELTLLDEQIERASLREKEAEEDDGHWGSSSTVEEAKQRGNALYNELAALNQEIAKMARIVGCKPSQAEIAQYQRRFVELCNQSRCGGG